MMFNLCLDFYCVTALQSVFVRRLGF